ncbi:MAG: DUF2726 domain-containing protein [Crocosphaera sp.]
MTIDQEHIYKLIREKKWLDVLKDVSDLNLEIDPLVFNALKIFEAEFFRNLEDNIKTEDSEITLKLILKIHEEKKHKFSQENLNRTVNQLEEKRITPIVKKIEELTRRKKWFDLVNLINDINQDKKQKKLLKNKTIIDALNLFEIQFFQDLESNNKGGNTQLVLEEILKFHKSKIYEISDDNLMQTEVTLAQIYDQQGLGNELPELRKEAYRIAKKYPQHPICSEIIESHEKSISQPTEHSQSNKIKVTENQNIANVDYRTTLFKSKQEIDFFMALRDVYPSYSIYPNVALSCVIDFEKIKSSLSQEQTNFFFKAVIDCVVFNQYENYQPMFFFELDSIYHDLPEQKKKDRYKDDILAKAGQKLYRIRKIDQHQGQKEFMKLIREIIS